VGGAMAVSKLRQRQDGFMRIFWLLESLIKQHALFVSIDFLKDL
jgi:hypothetical protein